MLPLRRRRPRRLLTLRIGRQAWRNADRDNRRMALQALSSLLRDLERGYTPQQAVHRAYGRRGRV
jgi:hypothetical protein